jgi:hypothetical protein
MKSFPSPFHYTTFRISIILLRKPTSFSENHIENLNHLGEKGDNFKNHIFHRQAATLHTQVTGT